MKNLLHLAAPGKNVGDNALILGVKSLFKTCNLELKNVRNTILSKKFIEIINEKYDGLIIGGGGLLHAPQSIRKLTNDTSGTLIRINTNNLKYLKIPLIVYGVGYNVFRGEQELPEIAKKSINDLANKALHFSVRNDGSLERLSSYLGFTHKKILEVPDPGLFTPYIDGKLDPSKIIIQIAADRLNNRFKNSLTLDRFIKSLKKLIDENLNYSFYFSPHCPIDEIFINKHFKNYKKIDLMTNIEETSKIMGIYRTSKVVIGQRGHGNICPFGINTPIICLVSHDKNLGFMRKIGFEDYSVSVNDKDLTSKLKLMIESIDKNYREKQLAKIIEMKIDSENFVNKIISQI